MKHIKSNFLVVSDYNWLPKDIKESWVDKYAENYLIYDRFHRKEWENNKNIKKQLNVGQNIYDIFDFIVENYENLPDVTIFCRAAFLFPKDTGTPRYNENGEKLSNGNCTLENFLKIANNKVLTELNDFAEEDWRFDNVSNKIGPNKSYLEINNSWYFGLQPSKYYKNIDTFFNDFYKNPKKMEYIRFSPGGCYIIPKKNILNYNIDFFKKIREILSWSVLNAEAHMIERALYTIFNCDYEIKEEYKN